MNTDVYGIVIFVFSTRILKFLTGSVLSEGCAAGPQEVLKKTDMWAI
jgi:hypothetical protein